MTYFKALALSLLALMMVMAPATCEAEKPERFDLTVLMHMDDCFCLDCYYDEVYCEAVAEFDALYADLTYTVTDKRETMRRSNGKLAYSKKVTS